MIVILAVCARISSSISSKMSSRTTYRLYEGDNRVSTAVTYKTKILQVYPKIQEFDTIEEWETTWTLSSQLTLLRTESIQKSATQKQRSRGLMAFPPLERRREQEFAEFLDPDYRWLHNSVRRVNKESLEVTMNDKKIVRIERSTNYMIAPRIWIDSKEIIKCSDQYSPALTPIRWLMMLLYVS